MGESVLKGLVSWMENSPEGGGAVKRGMVGGWMHGLGNWEIGERGGVL